ncbi:MAG: sensor histidine kinase [Ignavibacteriae bacterium HGW-Ignavibacteriae-2]|nr:MAG: sensor histidine kinase [Ignavibacteriae bacterium HGW-Ignavibacteriae-2]
MRKKHTLLNHIIIFVLAQIAWLMLMGIWIYWYVSNYIIFEKVGDQLSPQIVYDGTNVFAFVGGLVLLVAIAFGMSLTFRHLNVQLKLTRLYDNFIGNITHELKSPLSSIQLYLETFNTRYVPPYKQKEFIELMMKDSQRLKNLIDSILEISALEQKRVSHDYQVHNAGELMREIIADSVEQYQLQPNILILVGEADCKCVADINALRIVFNNLVDNAIKYSAHEPQIIIKLHCNAKKVVVEFSDKGIGISVPDQKNIFNKFQRIYNKDIPNVKGTGLGLYWVKEIIKNHGGLISVSSEGRNKGTTFRIELPIYSVSKKRYTKYLLKITNKRKLETEY